ncbi:MAG TPA: glycosyltransferase family 39 protein [Acidimicrobiales bacterium]|nr:glycosyltransferase family 39 protein [Acidimicrobiales bacterium]
MAAAVAAVGGLVLRLAMLSSGWGVMDADEAVVGLMARAILRGDLPTFYWGPQNYGGTAESFLVAPVFALTGTTALGLRFVTAALHAAAAVFTWRIGKRVVGPYVGAAAGLLVWLWPTANVFLSIRTRGFYGTTMAAGLAFVLATLRLAERPNRRDALLGGLAAGIGWWSAPQVLVFVIPAVLWVFLCARQALKPLLGFGLPASVVGAAPWLLFQLRYGLVSLTPSPLPPGVAGSYADHLETFATKGFPMALGLRMPWSELWVPGGRVLYAVALVALLVGLAWRRAPVLLWLGLLVFPLFHAVSTMSGYVGEGRYLVYYVPFVALALAAVVRHRLALPVLVVAAALLTVHTVETVDRAPPMAAPDRPIPDRLGPLVEDLEARGLTAAYAEYWLAYRLMFESDERIVVGIVPPFVSRRPELDRRVDTAERAAYVAVADSLHVHLLRRELPRLGVTWQEHDVGGFTVIVPDRRVTAGQLTY